MARTSISLPVPLSPSISTGPWPRAALAAIASAVRKVGAAPTIAPGVSTIGIYVGTDLAIDYSGFGSLFSLEIGAGGMVPSDFSKKPWVRQLTRLNVVVPLDSAPAGDGFGVLLSAGWFVDAFTAQGTTASSVGVGPTLNVGLAF